MTVHTVESAIERVQLRVSAPTEAVPAIARRIHVYVEAIAPISKTIKNTVERALTHATLMRSAKMDCVFADPVNVYAVDFVSTSAPTQSTVVYAEIAVRKANCAVRGDASTTAPKAQKNPVTVDASTSKIAIKTAESVAMSAKAFKCAPKACVHVQKASHFAMENASIYKRISFTVASAKMYAKTSMYAQQEHAKTAVLRVHLSYATTDASMQKLQISTVEGVVSDVLMVNPVHKSSVYAKEEKQVASVHV